MTEATLGGPNRAEPVGPLRGVRVVEMASLAPGPFAGLMLSDLGADVVRVDRMEGLGQGSSTAVLGRGRRSVAVDLKQPAGPDVVLRLVQRADILIEGFRPQVMERLGLGPDRCLAVNPSLVYGRMTGYGQDGPMAGAAGHDINYISVGGALGRIGRAGHPPTPPLNLVGDFGGGGMLLAFGLVCGLLEARATGRGQVIDAAMVDGSALLMAPFFAGLTGGGDGRPYERGSTMLDSGAPFYDAYETADGRWLSVGAIEPKFYAALLAGMGLADLDPQDQMDQDQWPKTKEIFRSVFLTRTRDDWCTIFEGTDACVTPVLDLEEVPGYPHNAARGLTVDVAGGAQPAPAPRFSVTPGQVRGPAPRVGQHTDEVLVEWAKMSPSEVEVLRKAGAVG